MNWRTGSKAGALAAAHLFLIGLSVSCGKDDTVAHSAHLEVPNRYGDYYTAKKIEFFLDEEVEEGTLSGWVLGSGCPVYVDLCWDGDCETVFEGTVLSSEEVHFEISSDDSWILSDFLDSFVPCYKDNEYASEPMSCQRWSCADSVDEIKVALESRCPSSLDVAIEVTYFDERVPFKGPLMYCSL